MSKNQILVLAQTPLQLMVGIAYARKPEYASDDIDIIISNNFRDAYKYSTRVAGLGLFRNTYFAEDYGLPSKPFLRVLYSNVVSRRSAKDRLLRACPELDMTREYDRLAFSSGTLLAHDLKLLLQSPSGKSTLFDDGIGTYTGAICFGASFFDDIVNDAEAALPKSYRVRLLVKRILCGLFSDKLKFNIDEVSILGNPAVVESLYQPNIQVNRIVITEGIVRDVKRVFMIEGMQKYIESEVIYFSLPDDVPSEAHEIEDKIMHVLNPTKSKIIVRLHPRRRNNTRCFAGCRIDPGNSAWEAMLISGLDLSDKVLIGFASTAQLFPQMLFEMKPTNILLNHLLAGVLENSNTAATDELFIKAYGASRSRLHILEQASEIAPAVFSSKEACVKEQSA